jgi:hypothetical protein
LDPSERSAVGLCATCRHARTVPSRRTVYWLCRLAATDPRFERYPRLPVTRCDGYEPGAPAEGEEGEAEGGRR